MVGMVLQKLEYFIPALVPPNHDEKVFEYFALLGEALTSSYAKHYQLILEWIEAFEFDEEPPLKNVRAEPMGEIGRIDAKLDEFRSYKGVLALDGPELVEGVLRVFTHGFGFTVDNTDEFREDFKLVDDKGAPFLLCEVKGTNKGIKREQVNQADSHRERSGYDHTFRSLLIVNTVIKNARSLEEKDQEVPQDQVCHAKRTGVLILRMLDLLYLRHLFLAKRLTQEEIVKLLTTNTGWLRVSVEGVSIQSGAEKESES